MKGKNITVVIITNNDESNSDNIGDKEKDNDSCDNNYSHSNKNGIELQCQVSYLGRRFFLAISSAFSLSAFFCFFNSP